MLFTRKTHRDHGTLWCNGTVRHAGIALAFRPPCLPILFSFSLLRCPVYSLLRIFLEFFFTELFVFLLFFFFFHFLFSFLRMLRVLRSLFEIFHSFFLYGVRFNFSSCLFFMRCEVDILLLHTWKCLSCVIFFFFSLLFDCLKNQIIISKSIRCYV